MWSVLRFSEYEASSTVLYATEETGRPERRELRHIHILYQAQYYICIISSLSLFSSSSSSSSSRSSSRSSSSSSSISLKRTY